MSSVKIQGSATGTAAFTIAVPDGTSTDRTITLPDAAGSFVLADGSNNVAVTGDLTVDTNTLYVDSANNRVGVGTASPTKTLHVASDGPQLLLEDTAGGNNEDYSFGVNFGTLTIRNESIGSDIQILSDTEQQFLTSGVERARITSSGEVLVGTTDHTPAEPGSSGNYGVSIRPNASSQFSVNGTEAVWLNRDTSDGDIMRFRRSLTGVGSISVTTTATSYNTSSDYRLKENVTELTGAIDRIKQVPVHRFNFIVDPDKTVDGFLAHEVADVVPEAIHGTKDEVDAEGNPVYQGIDQSKLVPLLTAAIKEQQALIEDLQTRLAALEAV